jgi:hypothetical protein
MGPRTRRGVLQTGKIVCHSWDLNPESSIPQPGHCTDSAMMSFHRSLHVRPVFQNSISQNTLSMWTLTVQFLCNNFCPILTNIAICRGHFTKIRFHEDRVPVGAQFFHRVDGQGWRTIMTASQTRSHSRGQRLLPSCLSVRRHASAPLALGRFPPNILRTFI